VRTAAKIFVSTCVANFSRDITTFLSVFRIYHDKS
jgi:hypothetical protein